MKYRGCFSRKLFKKQGFRCLAGMFFVSGLWAQGVLTWHNDSARTGQNLQETILSPSNVSSANFGLLQTLSVDGVVDAQPLYVPSLTIASATHNVLYVATENDSLYAFDADTGTQLWKQSSLLPGGETAVPDSDVGGCTQVAPTLGITSTPAIDLSSGTDGTIFLVTMSVTGSTYYQRLHALDLLTGAEESGWPVVIAATYPSTGPQSSGGVLTFNPKQYKERAALLVSNGVVYTTWASHCDVDPYNGWIIGYNESTRAQVVLNLTPNGEKGAIWQSGAGPAADAGGNLYFLMANGYFDGTLNAAGFPVDGDYGNAFMNVATAGGLAVADYFTSDNSPVEPGSQNDVDLGSSGPMLFPTLNDSMGNPHELAVGAGKDGNAYVVDRNNMGKYNGSSNAVYQQFALGNPVFSNPAWFNNTLYYGPIGSPLTAYAFSSGLFNTSSPPQTSHSFGVGAANTGATPSISANGTTNGIVWAADTPGSGKALLYAYNASTLSELYDSTQAASNRDSFGSGITFPSVTVANGKVFVPTTTGVGVFGLLNCSYGSNYGGVTLNSQSHIGGFSVPATSGCSWSATTTSNFITITGGSPGTGSGTVDFSIPANPGAQRVGTIVVAGNIYTITQSGADTLVPAPSNPSPANGSVGVTVSPTLSWAGSSGATSYVVYFGTSPTPPQVTSTGSTSYAPGTLSAGITYYWMVVASNSGGTNSSPVWSFTVSNTTPVSVTPSSGSGSSHTFAFAFSDTAGASDITAAQIGFNTSLAGTNSCWMFYLASTETIYLANNAGAFASGGLVVGSSGTLANSQCTINVATSSVSLSGNTLTLHLAMSFAPAFAGAKNIYMYVQNATLSNGFTQEGTWTVTGASGPVPVSVTPNSGSGASQTFAFAFSDTAGASDITAAQIGFNTSMAGTNSCWMYYAPSTQTIYLANNAGAFAGGGLVLGASGTLENSQCTITANTSSVSLSGNTLTLHLAMSFAPAFAGTQNIYMFVQNATLSNGFTQEGTWTVPGASGPVPVSVTPNSGSGASQTFAFAFSDSAGAADITAAQIGFNTSMAGTNSCWMYYAASTQTIYLANNAGAFAGGGLVLGASGTLENSQCTITANTSSVSLSGNTLTLHLAMSFAPAFAGTQNIYMYVQNATVGNGFTVEGTWTVPGASGPVPVSVTPNSGSGASQTFAFAFSDSAGAADITAAQIGFNTSMAGTNSCWMYYAASTQTIYLANDAGAFASGGLVLGASGTLENSQCTITVNTSSVLLSGNTLTLSLALSFAPAFAGTQNIYMYVQNATVGNGFTPEGTWTVP